jgi:hypothetical protein
VEEALKGWSREIKRLRRDAAREREMVPKTGHRTRMDLYRLDLADSMDRQADDLKEKIARLRQLTA